MKTLTIILSFSVSASYGDIGGISPNADKPDKIYPKSRRKTTKIPSQKKITSQQESNILVATGAKPIETAREIEKQVKELSAYIDHLKKIRHLAGLKANMVELTQSQTKELEKFTRAAKAALKAIPAVAAGNTAAASPAIIKTFDALVQNHKSHDIVINAPEFEQKVKELDIEIRLREKAVKELQLHIDALKQSIQAAQKNKNRNPAQEKNEHGSDRERPSSKSGNNVGSLSGFTHRPDPKTGPKISGEVRTAPVAPTRP